MVWPSPLSNLWCRIALRVSIDGLGESASECVQGISCLCTGAVIESLHWRLASTGELRVDWYKAFHWLSVEIFIESLHVLPCARTVPTSSLIEDVKSLFGFAVHSIEDRFSTLSRRNTLWHVIKERGGLVKVSTTSYLVSSLLASSSRLEILYTTVIWIWKPKTFLSATQLRCGITSWWQINWLELWRSSSRGLTHARIVLKTLLQRLSCLLIIDHLAPTKQGFC